MRLKVTVQLWSERDPLVLSSLSPLCLVLEHGMGPAHIQGGSSLLSCPSLESSSQTCPEVSMVIQDPVRWTAGFCAGPGDKSRMCFPSPRLAKVSLWAACLAPWPRAGAPEPLEKAVSLGHLLEGPVKDAFFKAAEGCSGAPLGRDLSHGEGPKAIGW